MIYVADVKESIAGFSIFLLIPKGKCDLPCTMMIQELRFFLELDGPLDSKYEWQMLQPIQGNFLEGTARLSKQLFGKESSVPQPGEITKPSTRTNDYLRRMREGFQSMKQDLARGVGTNREDEKELRTHTKSIGGQWDTLAETSRAVSTQLHVNSGICYLFLLQTKARSQQHKVNCWKTCEKFACVVPKNGLSRPWMWSQTTFFNL